MRLRRSDSRPRRRTHVGTVFGRLTSRCSSTDGEMPSSFRRKCARTVASTSSLSFPSWDRAGIEESNRAADELWRGEEKEKHLFATPPYKRTSSSRRACASSVRFASPWTSLYNTLAEPERLAAVRTCSTTLSSQRPMAWRKQGGNLSSLFAGGRLVPLHVHNFLSPSYTCLWRERSELE